MESYESRHALAGRIIFRRKNRRVGANSFPRIVPRSNNQLGHVTHYAFVIRYILEKFERVLECDEIIGLLCIVCAFVRI